MVQPFPGTDPYCRTRPSTRHCDRAIGIHSDKIYVEYSSPRFRTACIFELVQWTEWSGSRTGTDTGDWEFGISLNIWIHLKIILIEIIVTISAMNRWPGVQPPPPRTQLRSLKFDPLSIPGEDESTRTGGGTRELPPMWPLQPHPIPGTSLQNYSTWMGMNNWSTSRPDRQGVPESDNQRVSSTFTWHTSEKRIVSVISNYVTYQVNIIRVWGCPTKAKR